MKTTVETVDVELIDDGHRTIRRYFIATKNGILMTHRLEKLLNGGVIRRHEERLDAHYGDWHDIQSIGMVWQPPYQLLREIAENRKELQRELYMMEGESDLTEYPTLDIPVKECSHEISELIKVELSLRKKLKAQIRELDRIKASQSAQMEEFDAICTAWEYESCETEPKQESGPSCMPTPYSW